MLVLFLALRRYRRQSRLRRRRRNGRRGVRAVHRRRLSRAPCPGGWIADRLIGQRNGDVLSAACCIAAGNFILRDPATPAVFYSGLAVMVLGIGLLKPNVSSVVGALYEGQPGARRDAGFSIFYMGINLGATIGPIIAAGTRREDQLAPRVLHLRRRDAASALVLVQVDRAISRHAGLPPANVRAEQRKRTWIDGRRRSSLAAADCSPSVLFARRTSAVETQLAHGLFVAQVALAVALLRLRAVVRRPRRRSAKKRVGVIIIFFLCAALFWGGFEQQAHDVQHLRARLHRSLACSAASFAEGMHPAAWYQSINPDLHHPVRAVLRVDLGLARRAQSRSVRAIQDGLRPACC